MPCHARLIGSVTEMQKQYMMKVLIMFHDVTVKLYVKLCKCHPIFKAVPHTQYVVTSKNRSIQSQHKGGITPVKYNDKPNRVLFCWQRKPYVVDNITPVHSLWMSPAQAPTSTDTPQNVNHQQSQLQQHQYFIHSFIILLFLPLPASSHPWCTDTLTSHLSTDSYIRIPV